MALITAKPVKPPPGYAATAAQRRANQAKPYNALAPLTPAQMTTAAHQQLDPVVAALTSSIQGQADRASGAIGANSAAAAKALAGINFTAPYQQAESQQASVDAALRDSLAGGGQGLANDLSSRLAQIGDPSVAAAAGQVAGVGQAAGGTQVAEGSASLSNLLAQAAAAGGYGAKQPGIARLAGLQDIAKSEQQAQTDIASGKTTLLGQLPGIMQHLQDTELQKALARQSGLLDMVKVKSAAATLQERSSHDKALETVAQQNADTSAYRAAGAAKTAQQRAAAAQQAKKQGPKLTAYEIQKFKGTALTIAAQAHDGAPAVLKADGSVSQPALPKLPYGKAILEMEKEGVPAWVAIAAANRVYGKPLTPAQQRKQNQAVASGQGIGTAINDVFPGALNGGP